MFFFILPQPSANFGSQKGPRKDQTRYCWRTDFRRHAGAAGSCRNAITRDVCERTTANTRLGVSTSGSADGACSAAVVAAATASAYGSSCGYSRVHRGSCGSFLWPLRLDTLVCFASCISTACRFFLFFDFGGQRW